MMKTRNPNAIMAWIDSTRACSAAGKLPPKVATRPPNSVRISTHSTIEPSWFPHTPVSL